MKYSRIAAPPQYPFGSAEYAAQMHDRITDEIVRSEALALAIRDVVAEFCPGPPVERLHAALVEWLTGDGRGQLAALKRQSETPDDEQYSFADRLIYLTENRDRLQETVDAMEQRVRDFVDASDDNPATKVMIPAMELQVDVYRRQLKDLEDQISEVQAESTSVAVGDAPQTQTTEELGEC